MTGVLIAAALIACAVQAVRSHRLLISAIWLAATSTLVSVLVYILGAPEVAVIELSVGAGLVTVLFVFAINIAGDEPLAERALIPKPLAWTLVAACLALVGRFALSAAGVGLPASVTSSFATIVWEDRSLDVLLQIVLIFGGVLGVLGLLSGPHRAAERLP